MNKTAPIISVIIPSYNEATYINRLLAALTRQTFSGFEVIVSDATSSDGTAEVVQTFSDKLDIRLVQGEPKGPAVGRNEGAAVARGEWLMFLDADIDIDDRQFLTTMLAETEKHSWGVSTADVRLRERGIFDRMGLAFHHSYLRLLSHTKHPVAPGFCIFTRRNVFEEFGGYDTKLWVAEDYDYVSRAGAVKGFGFVNATYYYVDLRRFEEGGKFKIWWQSVGYEVYRFTHNYRIEKDPFNYKFGEHKERS